ncbi:hypothetical protein A5658_20480 [Mycobacterium sp. 1245111.1]|uniref:hypothetical protein n=1 Tax=Mycobacterium sp. 1245111.1 TaxID=1834073 RepID=UPI0007FE237A|nr:hypothetical protein [Mycobacterium sp. 1245111.1]OBK40826.1 hypothetical protein A5658_20480 [Mycobacterium sp. 1245111.1]
MTYYGDAALSDAQIAALSPAQRRDLIQRLERPLEEVFPPTLARRMRRNRLTLMVGGTIALIPWMIYLAVTLPDNYVAHNWPATWIGFDCVLIISMIATALLGWLRRQLVILPAFTTGVLLICDAWFDIMTAGPHQVWLSVLTAALANVPLAAIMIVGAVRLVRLTATRLWLLDPATPVWRLPMLP